MDIKLSEWRGTIFIPIYHLMLAIGLPIYFYYYSPTWTMVGISVLLFIASGVSITGGYHRLYSHRAYKASKIVEIFFLFFGSVATQGSVLRWAYNHRIHHSHVDTDRDPYAITKGFWYAHILWMFTKQEPIEPKVVPDLMQNKLVMFQHKYCVALMIGLNFLIFVLVGWALQDFLGAFLIAWWGRLLVLHHVTWFINSLAHTWGSRTYSKELTAADNYILSILTFGEGYHNYHHVFATDYRNGIKWYHFDPSKWLIWTLSKLGLVSDLKRMTNDKIKRQIIAKDRDLLLRKIEELPYLKTEYFEEKIRQLSECLEQKINQLRQLNAKYQEFRQNNAPKDIVRQVKQEMKAMRKSFVEDWNTWLRLCKHIMKLRPMELA